jgi:hypothetical protein
MPLSYILVISVLASIVGLMVDVSDLKTIDQDTQKELLETCADYCTSESAFSANSFQELSPALRLAFSIIRQTGQSITILIVIPLIVGTLFSFLWLFYIARSFKFTNAPLLGRQPGILFLVLFESAMLWAGLIGFKLLQLRSNSIGLFDFSKFGDMFNFPSEPISNAREIVRMLNGEGNALFGVAISSTLTYFGSVFLVLYRQIGIRAALSGLMVIVSVIGFAFMIYFSLNLENNLVIAALFVVPLASVVLIGLYILFSGRRIRRISMAGFSTLLYLLSFGPLWWGLGALESWSGWTYLHNKPIFVYFICIGVPVVLSEFLISVEYHGRLRPA